MSQKVQKTVEAPRMWYMNAIVDMLEMQRQVHTTQTSRRRKRWQRTGFHSLNIRTVCGMVQSSCLEVDARRCKVNEILATIRQESKRQ